MKVGQLYRFINIPFHYRDTKKQKEWDKAILLYLGENVFFHAEGVTVTNHLFYVNGVEAMFDTSMLKYLEKLNSQPTPTVQWVHAG